MTVCRTCGLDFSSVAAFDAHRVGQHAYTYEEGLLFDPPRLDGRRCLSRDEMRTRGCAIDSRERLVHPRETRRIRRQRRAEPLTALGRSQSPPSATTHVGGLHSNPARPNVGAPTQRRGTSPTNHDNRREAADDNR